VLREGRLASPTNEVLETLQRLHPHEDLPRLPAAAKHLSQLRPTSGRACSGLCLAARRLGQAVGAYEHVRAAAHGCRKAEAAAIKFVTTIVQGDLPQVPALLEASQIPVEKAGGGIQPIAVGGVVLAGLPVCRPLVAPLLGLA
jgi:hypothetical protein